MFELQQNKKKIDSQIPIETLIDQFWLPNLKGLIVFLQSQVLPTFRSSYGSNIFFSRITAFLTVPRLVC